MAVRLNNGIVYDATFKRIFVKDITNLTNDQIAVLQCGDEVVKLTGCQKHTYLVTFKKDDEGMCLTYHDATYSETVSYDLVDGVWTYNSTDTSESSGGGSGGTTVVANPTLSGDEDNLTGLEIDGTKYAVPQGGGSGTTLYRHRVSMDWENNGNVYTLICYIISSESTSLSLAEVQLELNKMLPAQLGCEAPRGQSGSFNLVGICRNAGGTDTIINGFICGIKTEFGDTETITAVEEEFTTASNPTIIDNITQI